MKKRARVFLKATVTPNARRFEVSFEDAAGVLKVRVCSPAEGGKANGELVKKLSKLFGKKVFIERGLRSREKEIAVEGLSDAEVAQKVNSLSNRV